MAEEKIEFPLGNLPCQNHPDVMPYRQQQHWNIAVLMGQYRDTLPAGAVSQSQQKHSTVPAQALLCPTKTHQGAPASS